MTNPPPIRVFISGACAGLAEVRQALGGHPEVEIVGTAVEPARAAQKLAASNAQVVLHGSSRGDRLPVEDIEAIRQATASPIILVTSGSANTLLQEALANGVHDVVLLPQLTDALVFTIRRTHVLATGRGQQGSGSFGRVGADGKIVTVFSPKGGAGKSTLATALSASFARRQRYRVLLVDIDLQFGDTAIMMGVEPEKTIYDVVMTAGDLDPDKLTGYVSMHPSGVHLIPAPVRPEDAELVAEDRVAHLLEVAKEAYDVVVVDTPTQFHATTLATLDRTDRLVLVASLDIPAVKNVTLTLQTLNLLQYPADRVHVVLNRPQPKAEIERGEVERALGLKVVADIPHDREVAVAVNRGVPVPMSAPRSPVTKAVSDLAERLLPEASKRKGAASVEAEATEASKRRTGVPKLRLSRKAA